MATQLAQDGFDTSVYPRTYGTSLGWKLFLVMFGALLSLGGLAGLGFVVFVLPHDGGEPDWTALCLGVGMVALAGAGVYAVLSTLMYRVILTADSVELSELFKRRRLSFPEIRGYRTVVNQHGPATLILVPKAESARKLKISLMLKRDPAFDAWLARLPNLDREEFERSEKEVLETLYQDQMPQVRQAHIERLKRIAKYANGATLALFVAAFVLPGYYRYTVTATLIALPWVAVGLVARFQPLYRFGAKRNDAHPDLSVPLMLPGLVLTMRALADAHTFDWSGSLLLALGGGLALGGAALRVDPWFRQQRWTAILMCVFLCVYGFGAGFEIDVLADSTRPTIYPTQVLDKRVSRSSKSTTYTFRVGPWGPMTGGNEIGVSAARYSATRTGDTVCVYVGKGALYVPWYQVWDCPQN